MSAARIRSALLVALKPLGFSKRGSEIVLRQGGLEHTVSVFAARRLDGYFNLLHNIYAADSSGSEVHGRLLVQETLLGLREPYLGLWSAQSFDAGLAARQSARIAASFSTMQDVTNFYSDRPENSGDFQQISIQSACDAPTPNSLSKAQEEAALERVAQSIFASDFTRAPRLGPDIWARGMAVGGFRHCAYLVANTTATFAYLLYFALAAPAIERGRKSDDVLGQLIAVRKRSPLADGQPMLIPMDAGIGELAGVTSALLKELDLTPPNQLPQNGTG